MNRIIALLFIRTWMSQTKRWLRVATYVACVTTVVVVLATQAVWGAVGDGALKVGSKLVALGDALGPNYRVVLNGAEVNVASTTTDVGVAPVLDRFESECREHTGGLVEEFQKLSETLASTMPPILKGAPGLGIIRKEDGDGGVVACLVREGTGGLASIGEAVRTLERKGDVSAFGHLRYVAAQKTASGKTHVVSVWTDGPLHMGEMFPSEGDVPGPDPGPAVRPPHAKRLLSASVLGAPFGVQVYSSSDSSEAVLAHYDAAMAADGWQPPPLLPDDIGTARAYQRGGVDLIVDVQPQSDTETTVSILSMPPR